MKDNSSKSVKNNTKNELIDTNDNLIVFPLCRQIISILRGLCCNVAVIRSLFYINFTSSIFVRKFHTQPFVLKVWLYTFLAKKQLVKCW
jgi:hypothetical protein